MIQTVIVHPSQERSREQAHNLGFEERGYHIWETSRFGLTYIA